MWLVIIGTNAALFYSQEQAPPYQGYIILAGTGYFSFVYRKQVLQLLFSKDFLLVLFMFVLPLLLMLMSDSFFERGVYTSQIAMVLIFVVVSIIALHDDFDRTLAATAFAIVAIAAALNLYELFVQNNVWSVAPGRSAGFYKNPNISGEALVGYGIIFMLARSGRLRFPDLVVMAMVIVGVIATFSRAGILAGPLLLTAATIIRAQRSHMPRIVAGGMAISLMTLWFSSFIFHNLDLSEDATVRVFSLIDSFGVDDYKESRGEIAMHSLDLAMESPITGAGVGTIREMAEGPHNMFLAVLVEYGILGLIIYIAIMIRLALVALRAELAYSGRVLLVVGWLIIFSFATHTLLGNAGTVPLLGFAVARAYQIQYAARFGRANDFA
ncbi:MAG: O-antigen ligase family protein [Burkholderiales bacterium]